MNRSRRLLAVCTTVACVVLGVLPGAATVASAAEPDGWKGLSPGEQVQVRQTVPVNVVLVGYDKSEVGADLRALLPGSSEPVVRYPQFYGLEGRDLGLRFDYGYRVIDAPSSFENAFFGHLADIGRVADRTTLQDDYNHQKSNNERVPKKVLTVDGPAAERYLERRARGQLGLDLERSYTVFLVNWYDRPDFRFHVYRKTDEPDPDTGVNFGELNGTAMIAWGGTSGRSWFYDLSAGPESWTSNWNVDDADVDGDGVPDYRMPPVWEYARDGYRSRSELGSDLGKVVRFVALNLLFTSSPLYDPLATAPEPGGGKLVQVTMFEDDPGSTGTDWIDLASSRSEWQQLQPAYRWRTGLKDVDPINSGSKRALDIFAGLSDKQGCWGPYGDPFAQPFCYYDARRARYLPSSGSDYVQGVFAFNTTDDALGAQFGLLGYADDNWVDGTPSYVFEFDTAGYRDAGYGFTTTTTHEVGHSLGLSHPHDGYDPASGLDYDPSGDFYFAWVGDESDTVMQYQGVSNGFGAFDVDNMNRYLYAGYLNWSNALAGGLEGASLSARQLDELARADLLAVKGRAAFQAWDHVAAASYALQAYDLVAVVAAEEGVSAELTPASALRMSAATASVPRVDEDPRHPEQ